MLYPFMTLPDETEIVHSGIIVQDQQEKVKVVIERPVDYGFQSAVCWLPEYRWENIKGFTDGDIARYRQLIQSLAHIIIELARDGGFEHAAVV